MLQTKKKFWGKKPGFDSGDILYVSANLGFSLVLGAMVLFWQLTALAVVLVVLSKWRVFAVQPRFWFPNIKANLVDIVVGVSSVGLMHQSQESSLAYIWVAVYAVWLLFIKPRGSELWISAQALSAQVLGLLVVFGSTELVTYAVLVSIVAWLVSWSAARHYFSNYDEPHYRLLSLVWALLITQIVWYSLHWLQYFMVGGVAVASSVLVVSVLSVTLGSLYHAYKHDKITKNLIVENLILGGVVLTVILLFSGWMPIL